jgi:hypothetical protein
LWKLGCIVAIDLNVGFDVDIARFVEFNLFFVGRNDDSGPV